MQLPTNRSMPVSSVIPVLAYPDVRVAVEWLCRVCGFRERLRIGDHRSQLEFQGASVVVTSGGALEAQKSTHSIMLRVVDAHALHSYIQSTGARVLGPPVDFPYGERQFSIVDPGGHVWTFSQTIADIDPASWGGQLFSTSES
ncbi:MAG: VOC family protein [Povalibacter sp.]|jgi:uncharacterized glyoxalase superfamily protein PhnB